AVAVVRELVLPATAGRRRVLRTRPLAGHRPRPAVEAGRARLPRDGGGTGRPRRPRRPARPRTRAGPAPRRAVPPPRRPRLPAGRRGRGGDRGGARPGGR